MLILFAPVLLVGTAFSLGVLRVLRPRFRFLWLASFGVAWLAWMSMLLWQRQLPLSLALPGWGSTVAFPTAAVLSANTLSWVSSFSLVSLLAASLVMAPARPDFRNSLGWAISLAFAGLALLAIAADNLLTVVLAWAALDLAEVSLTLHWANDRDSSSRAVTAFSVRTASIVLVLLALALGSAAEKAGSNTLLLIAAVALRLLVLPTQSASSSAAYVRNGVGATLPMASAAATLGLLSRIQLEGSSSPFLALLLLLAAGMALYAGWMWLRSRDALSGQAFLLLGLSSLAMASALQANPVGATGWGLSLILAGGALFLSGAQQTRLNRAVLIGGWSLSALPFSISAVAWGYQAGPALWVLPAFVLAQSLFLAGFLHHAMRAPMQASSDSQTAWLRWMYHAGLGFVLLLQLILGIWGWAGARQTQSWPAGLVATALGFVIFWGRARLGSAYFGLGERLQRLGITFVGVVTAMLRGMFRAVQQLVFGLTGLLEGDAGIMWGLLLLALFVLLIVGRNP